MHSSVSVNKVSLISTLLLATSLSVSPISRADALDEGVRDDPLLGQFAEALAAYEIDVSSNLNSRDVVRQRIRRARLGRFPDLPTATLADSEEIANWEAAYAAEELGGIAILTGAVSATDAGAHFNERWLSAADADRVFVTFYVEDSAAAENLARVSSGYGYETEFYLASGDSAAAGRLYATAAQRLAIDSRDARRYRTEVTELSYLGERVRRRSNSLFTDDGNRGDRSLARREPSVFMKETLGDEFNQSTISEIIVPGGVALGETAEIDLEVSELVFERGELRLLEESGASRALPNITLADAKALFDFVARSEAIESDAIVDIDADGRVRISSALRDTDVGYQIMHADTQPFEFVPNLPVTKSVVIDTGVEWRNGEDEALQFAVDFEVRFLSADNMRIAQTRVALEYEYDSSLKTIEYSDSWGRDVRRLHENLDYSGLGRSMLNVASYAGWIGLFRHLEEQEVPFLRGRYDFMKIDKAGQKTPIRY